MILLVCRDSTLSWLPSGFGLPAHCLLPSYLDSKEKIHEIRYFICNSRIYGLRYCTRKTGCVVLAAHRWFKWLSRYQLVRIGPVYISKISEAKKVMPYDMQSSTAGISRSTCRNSYIHLAFYTRCKCNTSQLEGFAFFQVVTKPFKWCFICFLL